MNYKKLLLSIFAAGITATVIAVPAKRGIFTVTQPDGTELRVQRVGDERCHFLLTEDRQLLRLDNDGRYCYSRIDSKGNNVSTGIAAAPPDMRTDAQRAVMQSLDDLTAGSLEMVRTRSRMTATASAAPSRSIPQTGMGRFSSNFPRTGKIRGLVILVQYSDVKFTLDDPLTYFSDMLNKDGFNQYGGTGSAHDYFYSNSNGKFDPQFDVYGPYTLPNNMKYYGGNDINGNDSAPEDMVVHACNGLNSKINFADYDMDNDGYVDNVFVFYAGRGEASGGSEDTVWPHQWSLSAPGKSLKLDGKYIDKYACSNEWEGSRPDGVGTFIHEFSHVMGLPDLYETTYSSGSVTPGSWSVLDYGPYNNSGRTPPNYSIYERNAMGWCEPYVLSGPESVVLENIADTNEGCIVPTTVDTEFFLIENRQKKGWDAYLPGHGMLVWHIDFVQRVWDNNAVNNQPNHMYVELEKASNQTAPAGWSFPGTSGSTEFTNSTRPSMKTWNGTNIDMPITMIEENNGTVTFDIAGGGSRLAAPELSKEATATADGFTVTWAPVEGATDYFATVTCISGDVAIVQNYDSSNLPDGWTKDSDIDTYTTAGNYKTGTQSLKLSKTGHTLTTCTYDKDIAEVSFWTKGQSTFGSSLSVDGLVDGQWQTIKTLTPENGKALTTTLDVLPEGTRAVRFVYTKIKGNVALDDITVRTVGGESTILSGYENVSTGGATSLEVKTGAGRANDNFKYEVAVKSFDGKRTSRASSITVDPGNLSGIDDVTADSDEPAVYYNLQGIRVDNPVPGNIYIMRRGSVSRLEVWK